MMTTTLTAREFNQESSRAKKAAADGPVFITDRGRPSHVLLAVEDYRRLAGKKTLLDLVSMPGHEDIDFDPPRVDGEFRPAEFD